MSSKGTWDGKKETNVFGDIMNIQTITAQYKQIPFCTLSLKIHNWMKYMPKYICRSNFSDLQFEIILIIVLL